MTQKGPMEVRVHWDTATKMQLHGPFVPHWPSHGATAPVQAQPRTGALQVGMAGDRGWQ